MKQVDVIIYKFTGRQGWFTVPAKVCKECDLTVGIIEQIARELKDEYDFEIKTKGWWINLPQALAKGCWQAPCVFVNDKLVSQGRVPEKNKLVEFVKITNKA